MKVIGTNKIFDGNGYVHVTLYAKQANYYLKYVVHDNSEPKAYSFSRNVNKVEAQRLYSMLSPKMSFLQAFAQAFA